MWQIELTVKPAICSTRNQVWMTERFYSKDSKGARYSKSITNGVYTESISATFFSRPSHALLTDQMHSDLRQYSCLQRLHISVFLNFKPIIFCFTRMTTVILCWALSPAKTQLTYTQQCAWTHPCVDRRRTEAAALLTCCCRYATFVDTVLVKSL